MPNRLSDENDRGQEQQRERDSSMKSAEFRFDPRIHVRSQEASVVGIGAVILERAGVAGIGRRAIVDNTTLVICVGRSQLPARGTFP